MGNKANKKARRRAAAQAKARRQRFIWLGGGVLILGLLVLSIVSVNEGGSTDPTGWDLPAMGPIAVERDRVALADYNGQPTVVNFFASWCEECDRELPAFATVSTELEDQVQFVGIASQETGDPMFMPSRHGIEWWPLARDIGARNGSGLSTALGARGMPLTAFYTPDGEIIHVQLGSMSEAQLRSFISRFYGIDS